MTTNRDRVRLPLHDDTKPVVCTIEVTDLPDHAALLGRLRATATGIERTPHGVLLWFPPSPDVAAEVRRFATQEKRCCQFWGFEVLDGDKLGLRWDGPSSTAEFMDRLVGYFEGREPIDALFGPARPHGVAEA